MKNRNKVANDLGDYFDHKAHLMIADAMDTFERIGLDRNEAASHIMSVLVKHVMTGMISMGVDKKRALSELGAAYTTLKPLVEEAWRLMDKEGTAQGPR